MLNDSTNLKSTLADQRWWLADRREQRALSQQGGVYAEPHRFASLRSTQRRSSHEDNACPIASHRA